jgi:acyl-CoA synthetase (NDP forming)
VLQAQLDPGLDAINPLDAWGTGRDFEQIFETCLLALMQDADSALGVFVCDLSDSLDLHAAYVAVCEAVAQRTDKPLIVVSNYSAWNHRQLALRLHRAGIAVLDGAEPALRAIRHALGFRDFLQRQHRYAPAPPPDPARAARWQRMLRARATPLTEDEGYALLADYGIGVPRHAVANDRTSALEAGRVIGYPLALKTAMPGILHKSEVGGVILGIADETALGAAYDALSARLGSRVLVTAQLRGTVEMAFGLVQDPAFGAFVMIAFGGIWIEYLKDSALAMAPLDNELAARLVAGLRLAPVLDGVRGAPPCDRPALVRTFVQLGALAQELGADIAEMDINPVFVGPEGVVAVDCLIVPKNHD